MFSKKKATKPDENWKPRVEELERRLKSIEIEWDEWYDKYRRLYARIAKRVKAQEAAESPENDEQARAKVNPLALRILNRQVTEGRK